MSKRTDVDALAELPDDEITERTRACVERMDLRASRASLESRGLTDRETQLNCDDYNELQALRKAEAIKEHEKRMQDAVDQAVMSTPRPVESRALEDFAQAIAQGVPIRVRVNPRAIETRSTNGIVSTNAGARGAVALNAIGRPEWLYTSCSIPFTFADSLTVSGPLYAALVAQSPTSEATGPKPVMTDPSLANATLAAFGVTQKISDQVARFGVGPQAISERLASESVFSVNSAFADAIETAAGEPLANVGETASQAADLAIARVWAQTGARPTALLVNSEDYPSLSDKAAVGPGDVIGAEVLRFNGIPLVVNDSITSGVGVAICGRAFSAHGTDVLLASLPSLTDNTILLRAETYAALLLHDAGAVVAVELASAGS